MPFVAMGEKPSAPGAGTADSSPRSAANRLPEPVAKRPRTGTGNFDGVLGEPGDKSRTSPNGSPDSPGDSDECIVEAPVAGACNTGELVAGEIGVNEDGKNELCESEGRSLVGDEDEDSGDGFLSSGSEAEGVEQADVDAFRMELLAHLQMGKTMVQAVQLLFGDGNEGSGPSAAEPSSVLPRHIALVAQLAGLAKPVLAALRADEDLCKKENVDDVAQLCAAMYRLAETDIRDAVQGGGRQRLNLGLQGIDDVAQLVASAERVVVLSGAGVSVSCGIPDFRSKGGVYETVLKRYGLEDPQAIFDLTEFRLDPTLFYSFAKDIMPSDGILPSATHHFIAELDRRGKLLRNYSQNIDGLEHRAGISPERVVLCHGSFHTATCVRATCRTTVSGSSISLDVKSGKVPMCAVCREKADEEEDSDDDEWRSVMKPDIVFFGESLPRSVSDNLKEDVKVADLVLVLGTSLQVAPVARIPQQFEDNVPRILVNRELVGYSFDIELLGNCDSVVAELARVLEWPLPEKEYPKDGSGGKPDEEKGDSPFKFLPPRKFLFPGAVEPYAESVDLENESGPSSNGENENGEADGEIVGLDSLYESSKHIADNPDPLVGQDYAEVDKQNGGGMEGVVVGPEVGQGADSGVGDIPASKSPSDDQDQKGSVESPSDRSDGTGGRTGS